MNQILKFLESKNFLKFLFAAKFFSHIPIHEQNEGRILKLVYLLVYLADESTTIYSIQKQ